MELLKSRRGKPILVRDNYQYRKKKTNKKSVNWECVFGDAEGCTGRLTTNLGGTEVKSSYPHSCAPDVEKPKVSRSVIRCKNRAREEEVPIPNLSSVNSSMDRNRGNVTGPTRIDGGRATLSIPLDVMTMPDESSFLLVDDGKDDRILILGNKKVLDSIGGFSTFFGDGTIKASSKHFSQLYTIHVDVSSSENATNVGPVLFALLPDKTLKTYTRLFTLIRDNVPNFKPAKFKMDCKGAVEACRKVFPGVRISLCFFQFNQCLWRNIRRFNLTDKYKKDEEFRIHVWKCSALALLPPEYVDDGWLAIASVCPGEIDYTVFNDYFVDNWLLNDYWNVYGESNRTTNALEDWRYKLKARIPKFHPNVGDLISLLRQESQITETMMVRDFHNVEAKKPKTKYQQLDFKITETLLRFTNHDKDFDTERCLYSLAMLVKMTRTT